MGMDKRNLGALPIVLTVHVASPGIAILLSYDPMQNVSRTDW